MIFQGDTNYYEVLEIRPDASAQEIRNAYLRLKASYRKDNPALYSVLDPSETEDMIAKIEEAFQVLSDPDGRRDYDQRNGFSERIERKIFTLDRAVPRPDDEDPLSAPATDFHGMSENGETNSIGKNGFSLPTQTPSPFGPFTSTPDPEASDGNPFFDHLPKRGGDAAVPPPRAPESSFIDRRQSQGRRESDRFASGMNPQGDAVLAEIAGETEWRGAFIKRIRELRRYSLDDVAQITKISKSYIQAIEEELYDKLPAPVFVRGFLLQVARTLKIPPEPMAQAYMTRYQKRPEG